MGDGDNWGLTPIDLGKGMRDGGRRLPPSLTPFPRPPTHLYVSKNPAPSPLNDLPNTRPLILIIPFI